MVKTRSSILALLVGGALAGGAAAQDATEGEVVVIEEEPAEDPAVVVEDEATDESMVVPDPAAEAEDVTGGAVVVEEGAEPVEGEAVIVEETEVEEVEVEEVEVETPVEGQIFEQSAEELLGSTLMDATAMSPDGDTIGDVEDVILSADGQITGIVIGVGGFLGIGEKQVAMAFDQIEVVEDELGELSFVLDATQEQLENAPEFVTQAQLDLEAPPEPDETAVGTQAVTDTDTDAGAVVVEPAEEGMVAPTD